MGGGSGRSLDSELPESEILCGDQTRETGNQAIKSYQGFVRDGLGAGHQEEYYEVKEQRYLGEDKFVESVYRAIDEQDEIRPIEITMAEILEVVAEASLTQFRESVTICSKAVIYFIDRAFVALGATVLRNPPHRESAADLYDR